MKPDHPSLTLPSTARIHYGRSYEIDHRLPIQALGLVHPASMETLLDQFDQNVFKLSPEERESRRKRKRGEEQNPQDDVEAAEMGIVKDMRQSITEVLGPQLAPVAHQPPKGTLSQFHPQPPRKFPVKRLLIKKQGSNVEEDKDS